MLPQTGLKAWLVHWQLQLATGVANECQILYVGFWVIWLIVTPSKLLGGQYKKNPNPLSMMISCIMMESFMA